MQPQRVDIIGIGVQKAASSWLFACLAEHPEIVRSQSRGGSNKELNFFNHHYEKGYHWYHQGFEFGPWKTLEFSVLYFHDADVPARIHRYHPDAKLLLTLRNPIDRAFSQHKHELRRGRLGTLLGFWEALEQNPSYIEQGLYARHLERWLQHFGRSQIHVVLHDDVVARPQEVIRDTLGFVGVDTAFVPTVLHQNIAPRSTQRSSTLLRLWRTSSSAVREIFGDTVHGTLKTARVGALVRGYNRIEIDDRVIPPLTATDRARLHGYFAGENQRLGALLGRDLSHWT